MIRVSGKFVVKGVYEGDFSLSITVVRVSDSWA